MKKKSSMVKALIYSLGLLSGALACDIAHGETLPVHTGFMAKPKLALWAKVDNGVWIENSHGGEVSAAYALKKAKRLVVSGYCVSACAWAFVMHPNACYVKGTSFGFHAAHKKNGKRDPFITAILATNVRDGLFKFALQTVKSSKAFIVFPREWDRVYGDRMCPWSR